MSCGSVRGRLSAYLEGDLSERDEVHLRTHLDGCSACRSELQALQRAVRGLRNLGAVEPPGDLAGAVMARLRAGEGHPPRLRLAPLFGRPLFSWVAPFAVAAGVGAIAWLGGLDGSGRAPAAFRTALSPSVVTAIRIPALRGAGTQPVGLAAAAVPPASLPSIASCIEGRVAGDACAHWYSWFVAMALEDTRGFVQEVERLPVTAREPWLQRVSEFARRSGSAPLVGHQLRTSRDPRASRIATRFDQGALVRRAGWSGR